MASTSTYSTNQLRDYASLFARNQVLAWQSGDFSGIRAKIDRYNPHWLDSTSKTYLDYLKLAYSTISKHYPNEYVFKNTFLTQWLIDELGQDESKVFSEFRVGKAVADLAMFNGVSKVFEVKSVLDNDNRLNHQLEYYQKVFNETYLVVPSELQEKYLKYDESIGVICFERYPDSNFKIVRKAKQNIILDPNIIMEILHTHEYKQMVKMYFGKLPEMNSFNQFNLCKKLIQTIPCEKLNELFIEIIKKRQQDYALSKRYFTELNQISLAMNFNKREREKLIAALRTPIKE
jgi:hypothetical protein